MVYREIATISDLESLNIINDTLHFNFIKDFHNLIFSIARGWGSKFHEKGNS